MMITDEMDLGGRIPILYAVHSVRSRSFGGCCSLEYTVEYSIQAVDRSQSDLKCYISPHKFGLYLLRPRSFLP